MKNAFSDTKSIWEHAIQEDRKNMAQEVVNLLLDHGIRIRQDDGQLRQVTLSKPSTIDSGFVVGLRYDKDDGTQTEDLFRVESGQSIKPYYKGALQREFPEYRGTHKQQVVYEMVATEPSPTTSVNTISIPYKKT
jgi:hypothetical protein